MVQLFPSFVKVTGNEIIEYIIFIMHNYSDRLYGK
ncbi:putative site-specific integrase-resolvase [Bacillus sp. 3255]|nr:putative site-specific integrase-resolvase [Bacillus sp. 3255]